ncbi:MAG: hypothetical protein GWN99_07630 [Gemmatimonadetes bacterium]|uniref:DUF2029 domain-containing protein n=1 Tax=Candidatus Kutchimonas denitrificans TaxID=3056748 RepID=A0AAE4Z7K9_9BACT|nr:hypothetical protein [Gemmatimonadota bacterium]NIR75098.1 hypothetical protein [Candidatus Kutchimonas denitrificans]NIS00930.1 hypothetical protein [Gemmatimonadota bacterium]NIT66547.1 hypothetical protein [Gemmatimonadota bacterium]NIU52893.1 hypothetical protein [Gemmatimonadota bacterium]
MTASSNASDPGPTRALLALGLAGAAQVVVYVALGGWDLYRGRPDLAVVLALTAFAFYLVGIHAAQRTSGSSALVLAIGFGVLFRAALIGDPPFLSDDYYRYLWDGAVGLQGINPYRYAPIDPRLADLDAALRTSVNHPAVPTIYPPLAQLVFLAVAAAGAGWLGLKTVWLVCDAAIAGILYRLVPSRHRLASWMIYWWSPLVVVEVAWNAHLDLLGVLPLVISLWLVSSERPRSVALGVAIAAAALVKYFAALVLPAAARVGRPARVVAAFLITAVLLYLPYAGAGSALFEGLATYARHWRFNESVYGVLAATLPSPWAAKTLATAVVVLIAVQAVRNEWSLERAVFWIVGAVLLLAPTVHPWYLLWMVPLVAIRFNRAWLYLSGSVLTAYYGLEPFLERGNWPQPWWTRLIIYGPFFVLLAVDAWQGSWCQTAWQVITGRSRSSP